MKTPAEPKRDNAISLARLRDVAPGTIVRVEGRWGVACVGGRGRIRVVDFWDGGREFADATQMVEQVVEARR